MFLTPLKKYLKMKQDLIFSSQHEESDCGLKRAATLSSFFFYLPFQWFFATTRYEELYKIGSIEIENIDPHKSASETATRF